MGLWTHRQGIPHLENWFLAGHRSSSGVHGPQTPGPYWVRIGPEGVSAGIISPSQTECVEYGRQSRSSVHLRLRLIGDVSADAAPGSTLEGRTRSLVRQLRAGRGSRRPPTTARQRHRLAGAVWPVRSVGNQLSCCRSFVGPASLAIPQFHNPITGRARAGRQ